MQIKQLFGDEDAVSPVIGVILMVAITVILAAVIASFVLGLGSTDDPAPNPAVEWSDNGTHAIMDVTGGDSFEADNVEVSGTNITQDDGVLADAGGVEEGDTVEAGFTIAFDLDPEDSSWEVDLIWNPADADPEIFISEES